MSFNELHKDNYQGYDDSFRCYLTTTAGTYVIPNAQLEEFYFIEDIFSSCYRGSIKFNVTGDILEFGNIQGTDKIDIIYGTNEERQYSFYIHNITNIVELSRGIYKIEANLIDPMFKLLNFNNYSLSFPNKTKYSDIVKEICKKHLGIKDFELFEESNETLAWYNTNNNTPFTNIKWLLRRCSGMETGQPGYLFYRNNTKNQYNFVTLEKLLIQTKYMSPNGNTGYMIGDNSNEFYINNVISHEITHIDQQSYKFLAGGVYQGYDPVRKKLIKNTYTYNDAINKFTMLGSFTLLNKEIEAYFNPKVHMTGETEETVINNIYFGDWIRLYCQQHLIHITVRGHEDRYAGGMIGLIWPSIELSKEKINKRMVGKCLVKSITHYFNPSMPTKFQQKLVLIKNGYFEADDPALIKAKKINR